MRRAHSAAGTAATAAGGDARAVAAHQGVPRFAFCAAFMRAVNIRMFASLRGRAT